MPATTDSAFTIREDGFDTVSVSYRPLKESGIRSGIAVDIECPEFQDFSASLSLDGAAKLAAALSDIVDEASSRKTKESAKTTTKPKK